MLVTEPGYAEPELTLADRTYVRLREEIITTQRPPGTLLREAELMESLESGRTLSGRPCNDYSTTGSWSSALAGARLSARSILPISPQSMRHGHALNPTPPGWQQNVCANMSA